MTITKYYKEYTINGRVLFVEQYADKPDFAFFWRYGVVYDTERRLARTIKDGLLSRPSLRTLRNQ